MAVYCHLIQDFFSLLHHLISLLRYLFQNDSRVHLEVFYVSPFSGFSQLCHLTVYCEAPYHSWEILGYRLDTFRWLRWQRCIGIETSWYSGCFPCFDNFGLIFHFLFEILKLSGDGCTGPRSISLRNIQAMKVSTTQLNSFIVFHVDGNKTIKMIFQQLISSNKSLVKPYWRMTFQTKIDTNDWMIISYKYRK